MSSDSDRTSSLCHHTHKRKKIIISDSSDESIILQTRKKKKIYVCIAILMFFKNCQNILDFLYFIILYYCVFTC